jgi:cytidylate kinase
MHHQSRKVTIAIDGHSSSGKSSFAKSIARELGYLYIDSGAMYRSATLYALRNGIIDDRHFHVNSLIEKLDDINIDIRFNHEQGIYETFLNGKNVEEAIRSVEVSSYVSQVSVIREVRDKMVEIQRKLGSHGGIVMDGRDIGTVVFPKAEVKIYLTASEQTRAERRFRELSEKGQDVSFEEILENIKSRDLIDSNREISPLKKADDALELDNSQMTPAEQMRWFIQLWEELTDEGRD